MKKNTIDIILLHGWGSNPDRWKSVKNTLMAMNPDASFHLPFVPGFDPKTPVQKPLTVDDYVLWLKEYIQEKGLVKPFIVGHSNGGRIAIRALAQNSNLATGLILIGAAGIPDDESSKKLVFKTVAKVGKATLSAIKLPFLERMSKKLLYKLAGESDYNSASPVMKQTMLNMLSYDAREDLAKINHKTLLLWGTNDTSTPLWMGEEMHYLLKNSHLSLISQGNHSIHLTHPIAVAKHIHEFLKSEYDYD